MPTTVSAGFDLYLSRLKPTSSEVSSASQHRESVRSALEALKLSRFFQTGSFSHGTGVRHYSDVDYLASFKTDRPSSSDSALTRVKGRLQDRFPATTVKVRRPAVVIEFAGGTETYEVVPAWVARVEDDDLVYDIPGASTGWIESAPDVHVNYVNDCNKAVGGGKAKGLVRLIKAWKYERLVPLSSFYLEMQAARYAKGHRPVIYSWDLLGLLKSLRAGGLAAMNDPSGRVGRIYAASSEGSKTEALSKLDTAISRAQKARDAEESGDAQAAFDWWDKVFDGSFPAYG
jgi:hypothetical protein